MCVECCWCLCIHKVSFRGASYFFASVHSYDGVSKLLNLVFKNVLLRTYFMDSRKTDLDMPDASADTIDLLSKSLYYLATTVTALLIFRGIEKEWRKLIQWTALVFMVIEAVALSMFFVINPEAYNSASCLVTLSGRIVFVFFYLFFLILYCRQLHSEEEKEIDWKWEPKFLSGCPGGVTGFGTLGFGDNTNKWLENKSQLGPQPSIINPGTCAGQNESYYLNDKLELPRYEVCRNSSKL